MTTTAVTTAPNETRSAPRSLAALTANYAINDTLVRYRRCPRSPTSCSVT